MKRILLLTLLAYLVSNNYAQDYMDKIIDKTCNCANVISDTLDIDQYNMALGACMIEAAMPYKKQLKKEYDINMDNLDAYSEKLGTLVGVKMASYCPDILLKLTQRSQDLNEIVSEEEVIQGVITKIESDFFVTFSLKDDVGKINKLYWLTFIETNLELTTDYSSLVGKSVEISYVKEEYFDPKIEQYRQFYIIRKINPVE